MLTPDENIWYKEGHKKGKNTDHHDDELKRAIHILEKVDVWRKCEDWVWFVWKFCMVLFISYFWDENFIILTKYAIINRDKSQQNCNFLNATFCILSKTMKEKW